MSKAAEQEIVNGIVIEKGMRVRINGTIDTRIDLVNNHYVYLIYDETGRRGAMTRKPACSSCPWTLEPSREPIKSFEVRA